MHRAGAAGGDAAAELGAGEAEHVAQHPQQRQRRIGQLVGQGARLAVDESSIARSAAGAGDCGGCESADAPVAAAAAISARIGPAHRRERRCLSRKPRCLRMIRSICAAALAAAALLQRRGAQAQTVVLYGLLDASGSRVRPVGGDAPLAARQRQHAAQLPRLSRHRGPRRRPARGLPARVVPARRHGAAGALRRRRVLGRDANVGLSGAFGTTVLGRNVDAALSGDDHLQPVRRIVRLLAERCASTSAPARVLGDTRWNNSIAYTNNAATTRCASNFSANAGETTPARLDRPQLRRQRRLHHRPVRGDARRRARSSNSAPAAAAGLRRARSSSQRRRDLRLQVRARLRPGRPGQDRRRPIDVADDRSYQLGVAVPSATA